MSLQSSTMPLKEVNIVPFEVIKDVDDLLTQVAQRETKAAELFAEIRKRGRLTLCKASEVEDRSRRHLLLSRKRGQVGDFTVMKHEDTSYMSVASAESGQGTDRDKC